MKRDKINIILLIVALIGVGVNVYRYYLADIINRPEFIILDVRILKGLEPLTIVHYRIKNVGSATAHYVATAVSSINGNYSLPAFFEKIDAGESVSVNLRVPDDNYSQIKVGISCKEFNDVKYYDVQINNASKILDPDFIIYNLSYRYIIKNNETITEASFWIMNIGSPAHNVNITLGIASNISIPVLYQGEKKMIIMNTSSPIWLGIHVEIVCDEGIRQTHYLTRYG
jgi:hypothetical protein